MNHLMRRLACVCFFPLLGGSAVARAAVSEVEFPAQPSKAQGVYKGSRVVLYGPVTVPEGIRKANGSVYILLGGVDMGGHACSTQLILVDASKPQKGPYQVDASNFFGSIGGMEGSPTMPIDSPQEVNDFEVKGAPFRPLTHLKQWKRVMVAVVIQSGDLTLQRLMISTDPNALERTRVGPRAAPRPVTCGDQTCSGDAPICCLSKGNHTCTPIAACVSEPSTVPLGCTQPEDCPGQRCCLNTSPKGPTFTTCQPEADCPAFPGEAGSLPMCHTAADCPPKAGKFSLKGCEDVMYMEQTYCVYR
jgi:hypothetical protein